MSNGRKHSPNCVKSDWTMVKTSNNACECQCEMVKTVSKLGEAS